ncbi:MULTISPECIES: type A2 lanthipeptide [Bacillus cereus group]|uniref:Lantibiotic n=2 Tax=Bacillus cereus group TaxID=86661 RepID=A0A2B9DWR8_BACCE|nr:MULTISPECIES: type A2 lanthipeptide [Bacillus cereus group]PEE26860.1 Columbicin A-like bacteriocin peptide [Bacillus toyonensis]PGD10572.1 Columbicin A-like bacteriocin peptide [Bacillus toyonensis]PGM91511.1 Columbicin A-like bacteriocin peptide [Bacillus cereus]TKI85300.1 type A2 lantipeptide [Bacillus mycoides]
METEKYLQVVEDEELEQLVGGAGPGWVETLTKDCPWKQPVACITIMGQRICKKCY